MPVIAIDRHYYLLPSGDLLIAAINSNDLRRQFRCRMAHQFTGERIDSINWARVKIRGFFLLLRYLFLILIIEL